MNGYFSVFNPKGEKIADCGILEDAVKLVGMRNRNWDGHYYQFKPTYETVDVTSTKYLSTNAITISSNDEVIVEAKRPQLNQNDQDSLKL